MAQVAARRRDRLATDLNSRLIHRIPRQSPPKALSRRPRRCDKKAFGSMKVSWRTLYIGAAKAPWMVCAVGLVLLLAGGRAWAIELLLRTGGAVVSFNMW